MTRSSELLLFAHASLCLHLTVCLICVQSKQVVSVFISEV